jgi:hypothetical protein
MASDTDAALSAIQHAVFRRMKPEERLHLALEMSESLRNVALAGLRSRHPELSPNELSHELMRLMYGIVVHP